MNEQQNETNRNITNERSEQINIHSRSCFEFVGLVKETKLNNIVCQRKEILIEYLEGIKQPV